MKLADLFTRSTANESRQMFVELPDGSISNEFYLEVLNTESDAFRRAETLAKRKAAEAALIKNDEESVDAQFEIEIDMLSSLVTGWNLDEKFSRKAVKLLLKESTNNRERVSRFAVTKSYWFAKKPNASSTGTSKD